MSSKFFSFKNIFLNKKYFFFLFILLQLTINSFGYTYYSIAPTSPHFISSWNTQRDGIGGSNPPNFTTSGDVFIVQGLGGLSGAPHTMTTTSTWNLGANTTVEVETGAVLQANSSITFNATANFILDSAATYNHNNTGNYAAQILQGIENFHKKSNFIILNSTGTGPGTPANGGFGNLILNSNGSSQVNCNGLLTDIKNNFIIQKTGNSASVEFRLTGTTNFVLNIGGNLEIQNGILNFTNGAGLVGINLNGDFIMSGGELKSSCSLTPNSTQGLNFEGDKLHNFIKSGGIVTASTASSRKINFLVTFADTLNMGNYIMDNAVGTTVDFNISGDAALKIGHASGISSSGASGNIQVTGIRNFQNNAYYEYNGTTAQITGNGLPSTVAGLTINNSSGLTLSNANTNITNKLNLANGRIFTDATHSLTKAVTATIVSSINNYNQINQGNSSSFISGPLKVDVNSTDSANFPIGKDSAGAIIFAPIRIKPYNAIAKTYSAEYFQYGYDTAHHDATINNVSKVDYWDIKCSTNAIPDANAFIELSWNPRSALCVYGCTTLDSTNAWSDLAVAHYYTSGAITQWWLEGSSPTYTIRSGSNLSYGYIKTDLDAGSFSPFTLISKGGFNYLPLKLSYFSASNLTTQIKLQWQTENEVDVDKFNIQKSIDGIHFTTFDNINATNLSVNNYTAIDFGAINGRNYYRLKVMDKFGKISYSNIILVVFGKNINIQTYPNPTTNTLYILHNKVENNGKMKIYNSKGQLVISKNMEENKMQTQIDVSSLSSGIYFIILGNKEKISFIKL